MKYKFLLLLLSVINLCFSQTEINNTDSLHVYLKNYEDFEVEDFRNQNFIEKKFSEFDNVLERELDFSIIETIYEVYTENRKDKSYIHYYFHIHVFKENSNVIGILVNQLDHVNLNKFYFDSVELESFMLKHNDYYGTKFSLKEFINQISENHSYGYLCTDSPVVGLELEYNNLKFRKRNKRKFEKWIKSFNPELQAYGVDALKEIEKKSNYKISNELNETIAHIQKRNSIIRTCSGCLGGIYRAIY